MERRTPWLGYLCVILSAVIFGCMPLGANFLYAQGVTPMTLVFLRNLLSLPVLALLCQKQGGLRISRGALLETSLTAFGCCIAPILLFSSYRYLASGMATVFPLCLSCHRGARRLCAARTGAEKRAFLCAPVLVRHSPSHRSKRCGRSARCCAGAHVGRHLCGLYSALAHFRHREVSAFV